MPGFVRDTINNKFAIIVSLGFLQIKTGTDEQDQMVRPGMSQKETIKSRRRRPRLPPPHAGG